MEKNNISFKYVVLSNENDLLKSDCIMIIIMTHGLYNDHLYSKDTHYPLDDLRLLFPTHEQFKSLAGKPKLFIIQVLHVKVINQNKTFSLKIVCRHSWAGLQGYSTRQRKDVEIRCIRTNWWTEKCYLPITSPRWFLNCIFYCPK